jgi:hypothetical protein
MGWLKRLFSSKKENSFSKFSIDQLNDKDLSPLRDHMDASLRIKKKGEVNYTQFNITIEPEIFDRICKLSDASKKARSEIARGLIKANLENFERHHELIVIFDRELK